MVDAKSPHLLFGGIAPHLLISASGKEPHLERADPLHSSVYHTTTVDLDDSGPPAVVRPAD